MNLEIEKMSDEELNGVAGGNTKETANDSRFLNSLNGSTDRYGETKIRTGNHDAEISLAWAKLGVQAVIQSGHLFSGGSKNLYYINGKEVTQASARFHAMEVANHYIGWDDWKY